MMSALRRYTKERITRETIVVTKNRSFGIKWIIIVQIALLVIHYGHLVIDLPWWVVWMPSLLIVGALGIILGIILVAIVVVLVIAVNTP